MAVDVEVPVLLGVTVGECVAVGLAVGAGVLVGVGLGVTGRAVAVAGMEDEGVRVWTSAGVPAVGRTIVDVETGVTVGTMPGVDEGVSAGCGVSEAKAPGVGDDTALGRTGIAGAPP